MPALALTRCPAAIWLRARCRLGETLATASGKLAILDRLLRSLFAGGHRVVLFSFFTSMLDILEAYFDERKIPCVASHGGVARRGAALPEKPARPDRACMSAPPFLRVCAHARAGTCD